MNTTDFPNLDKDKIERLKGLQKDPRMVTEGVCELCNRTFEVKNTRAGMFCSSCQHLKQGMERYTSKSKGFLTEDEKQAILRNSRYPVWKPRLTPEEEAKEHDK